MAPADALLSSALEAAKEAGVSRLADITRLDRVGLPVWQTVRPRSRALSVHQGKGATHGDAKLGALLEAVESDAAERFDENGPTCRWKDLPQETRPANLGDWARDREAPPADDFAIRWTLAERFGGGDLFVPFSCVSLDFTIDKDSIWERASAGVATGSTHEEACRAGLLELIERDAASRFHATDYFERLETEVRLETVDAEWFGSLKDRLDALSLGLRLFAPPSPTGVPVFMAAITDRAKAARPYAGTVGHAAHPDPEVALIQAIAEALQSRLTFISGAREDCWPSLYTTQAKGIVAALAPPPVAGIDGVSFDQVDSGPQELDAIADRLTGMGCHELAFVKLAQPNGFHVVRCFAPGLGSLAKGPRL